MGSSACRISAAVVPGAKLDICTTAGPPVPLIWKLPAAALLADPRMLTPTVFLGAVGGEGFTGDVRVRAGAADVAFTAVRSECSAAKRRLFCSERATAGAMLVGGLDTRLALGLVLWWRSWVQRVEVVAAPAPAPEPETRRGCCGCCCWGYCCCCCCCWVSGFVLARGYEVRYLGSWPGDLVASFA